jgi:hypothetical protein
VEKNHGRLTGMKRMKRMVKAFSKKSDSENHNRSLRALSAAQEIQTAAVS